MPLSWNQFNTGYFKNFKETEKIPNDTQSCTVKPELTTTSEWRSPPYNDRPPFFRPIFTFYYTKLTLNNDHLSTTAANLRYSKVRGRVVVVHSFDCTYIINKVFELSKWKEASQWRIVTIHRFSLSQSTSSFNWLCVTLARASLNDVNLCSLSKRSTQYIFVNWQMNFLTIWGLGLQLRTKYFVDLSYRAPNFNLAWTCASNILKTTLTFWYGEYSESLEQVKNLWKGESEKSEWRSRIRNNFLNLTKNLYHLRIVTSQSSTFSKSKHIFFVNTMFGTTHIVICWFPDSKLVILK